MKAKRFDMTNNRNAVCGIRNKRKQKWGKLSLAGIDQDIGVDELHKNG